MAFVTVFHPILVLLLLAMTGYVARRLQVVSEEVVRGLSHFLVKIALPALILSSFPHQYSLPILKESGMILAISFVAYLLSFVVSFLVSRIMRFPASDRGVLEFVMVFSNVGFMGYPVVEAIFGKDALFYAAIYNIPFNLLVFSVGIFLLSRRQGPNDGAWKKAVLNPCIVSVFIGFGLFLSPVKLPGPAMEAVTLLGSTTTPLSMLVIGALLTHVKTAQMLTHWRMFFVSTIRLLVMPCLLWLVFRHTLRDPLLVDISVIIAAMPAAANTVLLAEEYEANAELASQCVFVSTCLCLVTIPLMTMALGIGPAGSR